MERTLGQRHSSCLWFQMFGVEAYSFLPDQQRDRRDLACQGETRHLRLDPLGDQSLVKLLERTRLGSGQGRGTLEQVLEIVIVIQPANRDRLLGALQLSLDIPVLGTAVRLDCKPTVAPELSLGAKPVGRLQQRDQKGRSDRTDRGDLTEQLRRAVLPALR